VVYHGNRTSVITPVLFGTFTVDYPRQISPEDAPQDTVVTFTPVPFFGDLDPPSVHVWVDDYTGNKTELIFNSKVVENGDQTTDFKLKKPELVDYGKVIRWRWATQVTKAFMGSDFTIVMQADPGVLGDQNRDKPAALLPVKITLNPPKPWWEKYLSVYGVLFGGVCAIVTFP
jgi:hypothetical protein